MNVCKGIVERVKDTEVTECVTAAPGVNCRPSVACGLKTDVFA